MKNCEQKFLDQIETHYFRQNFGTLTKSEFELFVFEYFLNKEGGDIYGETDNDYYALSLKLGISDSKFNNLYRKYILRTQDLSDTDSSKWQGKFIESLKSLKYDEEAHRFKLPIRDPTLISALSHFIEKEDWFDEGSLNRKVLVLQPDCLLHIISKLSDIDISEIYNEKAKTEILEEINPELKLKKEFRNASINKLARWLGLEEFAQFFIKCIENDKIKASIREKITNSIKTIFRKSV